MVIATLQAEAGKLWIARYYPGGHSTWCYARVTGIDRVRGLPAVFASTGVFVAALTWAGGRARTEPDANGPRHLPDLLSGAGQGSAAGAAIGSVTCWGFVLSS